MAQVNAGSNSYDAYIAAAAKQYDVPEKLIRAIITQESQWNPNARSGVGAGGLMQIMPKTAVGLGVTNVYDPKQNIMGGTKYISQMLKKYKGDVSMALAAYNAGEGNVAKYGGIPPFPETKDYVKKVLGYYNGDANISTPSGNTSSTPKASNDGLISSLVRGVFIVLLIVFLFLLLFMAFPSVANVTPVGKAVKVAKAVT